MGRCGSGGEATQQRTSALTRGSSRAMTSVRNKLVAALSTSWKTWATSRVRSQSVLRAAGVEVVEEEEEEEEEEEQQKEEEEPEKEEEEPEKEEGQEKEEEEQEQEEEDQEKEEEEQEKEEEEEEENAVGTRSPSKRSRCVRAWVPAGGKPGRKVATMAKKRSTSKEQPSWPTAKASFKRRSVLLALASA